MGEDGLFLFQGRIFVPDVDNLQLRVLQGKHNHPLAGHFGQKKTLKLVKQDYTWPRLWHFVQDYVNSCSACLRNKSCYHPPYSYLKQLPIPLQPWESISMDFVEQLPTSNGYTDILVVVDRLTKQAIFVPTYWTINMPALAELFIIHVFSKHGAPLYVTLDRGSEFVSRFFRSLATALGIKLHFTSGYHPEGNGQTEQTNQTLEQYLRIYCNYQQSTWSHLLPLTEFAYNNAPLATTGLSLFFANKGYHPQLQLQLDQQLPSEGMRPFLAELEGVHSRLK